MSANAPDYEAYQSAFHEAFRAELYAILDALPLASGGRALDVPCGNGFYTQHLAQRLEPGARLTAVDASDEYLRLTRAAVAESKASVVVQKADAYQLPLADATFDLVWCAQSLISLEPARAVREMFRVTRPDGVVAILEVDEFHHVLLPWPVKLEAAIPLAVRAASVQRYGDSAKLAPARKLRGILKEIGFADIRRVTYAFDRAAPLDQRTTSFLGHHFEHLRSMVYPHLTPALQTTFERMTDPDAAESLFRMLDAEVVCINAVYLARPGN